MEAYIERIKEVNPFLNAVVDEQFEVALSTAKIYDEKLKTGEVSIAMLEKEKPLYGVPVTIKESCSLEGQRLPAKTLNLVNLFKNFNIFSNEKISTLKKEKTLKFVCSLFTRVLVTNW